MGKPAFCGRCQRRGHQVWQGDHRVRCGLCSQNHDTKICKEQIAAGVAITPKCANCLQEHNAWSIKCSARPDAYPTKDAIPSAPSTVAVPPVLTAVAFPHLSPPSVPRPWSPLPSSSSLPRPTVRHSTPTHHPHHTQVPESAQGTMYEYHENPPMRGCRRELRQERWKS